MQDAVAANEDTQTTMPLFFKFKIVIRDKIGNVKSISLDNLKNEDCKELDMAFVSLSVAVLTIPVWPPKQLLNNNNNMSQQQSANNNPYISQTPVPFGIAASFSNMSVGSAHHAPIATLPTFSGLCVSVSVRVFFFSIFFIVLFFFYFILFFCFCFWFVVCIN